MTTPRTDIVIPFRSNRQFPTEPFIERCVDTLVQYTQNFRLIFVDDNSDQIGREFIQKIADRFTESTLVRTNKQKWFTRAVNIGLRLVKTEWAVEVNSDCEFGEGWLEELYAVRDELTSMGGKVGLVGSVYNAGETRRYFCTTPTRFVTGHCWLLNMKALKETAERRGTSNDYLDETSPKNIHIFSDNQLCYDLNGLGYVTAEAYKSGVGHIAGKSWGHLLGSIPQSCEQVDYHY